MAAANISDAEALNSGFAALRDSCIDLSLDHRLLLDGVRQLVSDQLLSTRALGLELVFAEKDVFADSEGAGAETRALLRGGMIGVNANVGEVCAEPRLHVSAH